jgi:hypothetical protein
MSQRALGMADDQIHAMPALGQSTGKSETRLLHPAGAEIPDEDRQTALLELTGSGGVEREGGRGWRIGRSITSSYLDGRHAFPAPPPVAMLRSIRPRLPSMMWSAS